MADEPTGNLDTKTSHEIMETLVKLNREQGVTIIVVTHESDIAAYASRVVTMRDGQIVSDRRMEAQPGPEPSRDEEQQPAAVALFHPHEEARLAAAPSQAFLAFGMMILSVAAQAINRNRMRSALTMLGVFIGVAALIAMVAVGQGANEAVRKQIESLGTNLLVVVPGAVAAGGFRGGFGSASTLTISDVQAIRREASFHRQGELSHPPAGTGPVRQSELGNDDTGRQRQLSADHQLADRRRPRDHSGRREQSRACRACWARPSSASFSPLMRTPSAR